MHLRRSGKARVVGRQGLQRRLPHLDQLLGLDGKVLGDALRRRRVHSWLGVLISANEESLLVLRHGSVVERQEGLRGRRRLV
jgi:hypothetical protein